MAVEREFAPEPDSAGAVRHFVAEALPPTPRRDDIILTASELAANVIRHARTRFTVRVGRQDEAVRLEISDGSSIVPAIEELSESHRGLRMIAAISEQWGIDRTPDGKVVWAEFDLSRG